MRIDEVFISQHDLNQFSSESVNRSWVRKFETIGSTINQKPLGCPRLTSREDTCSPVNIHIQRDPGLSSGMINLKHSIQGHGSNKMARHAARLTSHWQSQTRKKNKIASREYLVTSLASRSDPSDFLIFTIQRLLAILLQKSV